MENEKSAGADCAGREPRELRGAPVAKAICGALAPRVERLADAGVTPRLAIVRVGEGAGELAYERGARSRMAQAELERTLRELADNPAVHGILMMRPLPPGLDEATAIACVPAAKDVDGMTTGSLAATFSGTGEGFAPCTAEAVVRLLEHYQVPLAGARVTVLGRSLVVGRPVAQLLLACNATVTVCHSRTRDLTAETRRAEVLVSCMGRAHAVTADMVSLGAVVVDVGTNDDGNGSITGDVDCTAVSQVAAAVTPVPRGVGSVTTSVLAEHVVAAAERAQAAAR